MTASAPFTVVIPARYASQRLPAKALADIDGKPMVVRVAERAVQSGAARVIIATDHQDILVAARAHECEALITRAEHATGTDRIAEVVDTLGLADDEIVVNAQGDEPLIPPVLIAEVAQRLAACPEASIATACHRLHEAPDFFNPNVVKVVCDHAGYALYFSRAPIPYARDAFAGSGVKSQLLNIPARDTVGDRLGMLPPGLPAYRHLGIYAYRARYLRAYAGLSPADIETFESLEQLRALVHGHRIAVVFCAEAPPPGVDTAEDLARVRALFAQRV